jgi:large subunit ribosomal protein L21
MFAVLKTGGKQYRVQAGDVLRVEKLAAEAGETVQFNDILMVGANVGAPLVAGAAVQATVIDQIKGEKVIHFVKRRRKHGSQRTKGHRQSLTLVRITEILEKGARQVRREGRDRLRQRRSGGSRPAPRPRPRRKPRRRKPRPRRSNDRWHTRRQAVRPATAATAPVGVSASSSTAASTRSRATSSCASAAPSGGRARRRHGPDHTIFATAEGAVTFHTGLKGRTFISVLPMAEAAE